MSAHWWAFRFRNLVGLIAAFIFFVAFFPDDSAAGTTISLLFGYFVVLGITTDLCWAAEIIQSQEP